MLERFTNFILNNPVSKAIGSAIESTAEYISSPPHVRAVRKDSRIIDSAKDGDVKALEKALKKAGNIDYANDTFVKILVAEAAENGQKEVLQLLLNKGASPVGEDRWGIEPAEAALKAGKLSIVELLHDDASKKGLPITDKLRNAFSAAQEARAQQGETAPDAGKPVQATSLSSPARRDI